VKIQPARITAGDVLNDDCAPQLVTIDARVVDRGLSRNRQQLNLEAGNIPFEAVLAANSAILPAYEPGTLVRLTGVCSVESFIHADNPLPSGFALLLRTPADVLMCWRVHLGGPPPACSVCWSGWRAWQYCS
jgi:hypothetical protein